MAHVHSQTDSGLVLAQDSMDVAAVERALKHHDRCLELQGWPTEWNGKLTTRWKVIARPSADAAPSTVYVHQTAAGEPLPLSSAIVDAVQQHDRNTRGSVGNVDELTERLKQERYEDYLNDAGEIVRWFGPRLDGKKSSPLPRSQSLRMARDKARAREKNPEFRP